MAKPFRIGTYNVENLFDRFDDPYSVGDDTYGRFRTMPKSRAHAYDVAQRIRKNGVIDREVSGNFRGQRCPFGCISAGTNAPLSENCGGIAQARFPVGNHTALEIARLAVAVSVHTGIPRVRSSGSLQRVPRYRR